MAFLDSLHIKANSRNRAILRQPLIAGCYGTNKLDGEFTALVLVSSRASTLLFFEVLTANTLKSEVFPAFCKPIMVMSISVALYAVKH